MFLPETRFRWWVPCPRASSVQWEQNFNHRVTVRVLRCAGGPVVCQLLRKWGEGQEHTINISSLSVWTSKSWRAFIWPYRCLWLHNEVIVGASAAAIIWQEEQDVGISWLNYWLSRDILSVLSAKCVKLFKHILAVYCRPVPLGDIEFSEMLITLWYLTHLMPPRLSLHLTEARTWVFSSKTSRALWSSTSPPRVGRRLWFTVLEFH